VCIINQASGWWYLYLRTCSKLKAAVLGIVVRGVWAPGARLIARTPQVQARGGLWWLKLASLNILFGFYLSLSVTSPNKIIN